MHHFLVLLLVFLVSCSKSQPLPHGQSGPWVQSLDIPEGKSKPVHLSNGADIVLHHLGGSYFFQAEGALTDREFENMLAQFSTLPALEKELLLNTKLGTALKKIQAQGGIPLSRKPNVGYFSFLMPYSENVNGALLALKLGQEFLVHPVFYDPSQLESAKKFTPESLDLVLSSSPRSNTDNFSGLKKINAVEFVKIAERDILDGAPTGKKAAVDGSNVLIGITDTGITYNHPTFQSLQKEKKNRIQYLKDFTKEGRVYFNPKAKFEAAAPVGPQNGDDEDLIVNAEVLVTPRLPSLPMGDDFVEIKGLRIKVSQSLKAILLAPGNSAKLGVLSEDAFQGAQESVDLNANGKLDDHLFMILIPGATEDLDAVYLDPKGTGDFRNSDPIGSWNNTKQNAKLFSEKVGFDLGKDSLPNKAGNGSIEVRFASLVGFDPGNHGTHVAGIAAGSKTISNDKDLTLARGVAPEATILLNRVCANNGGCNATEAFIDLVTQAKAEVINMSLGGLNPFNDGYGFQEMMINRLTSLHNVLFVISAGNSGPGRQTVGSPSVARLSLSVGASASMGLIQRQYQWIGTGSTSGDDSDFLLFFSSRGPTAAGGFKPNLVAPGTELSSIQLNAPQDARAGLDVYWGTSMAAPTATGAYALFLDAVKKYNDFHPEKSLPTQALILRQVLISSAKPFDVDSYDPETGQKTNGQYTWIDEGTGMIDLVSAWKKLFEVRDAMPPSAVSLNGKDFELDYKILVPAMHPNGIAYDGSRMGDVDSPAFGTGIYLDFRANETLRKVHISRNLPGSLMSTPEVPELLRQLYTSQDEFVLKTRIYGSDKKWLKVGVLDQLNCSDSETARLSVLGKGVTVTTNPDGSGSLGKDQDSALGVCIDREMLLNQLMPGDHGALISAYRVVGDKIAPIPSFIVPVYVTVPHKTLEHSSAYDIAGTVNSFGVSRNYVEIPEGTSAIRVTLEVPTPKLTAHGNLAPGETCSGVELMALEGDNVTKPISVRKNAQIANCASDGTPVLDVSKRQIVISRSNPKPGIWDLHVFGQYRYALSRFKLRIDYVTGVTSVEKISGGVSALNGSLNWILKEASQAVSPDREKSTYQIDSLFDSVSSAVGKDETVFVESPLGILRVYPKDATRVTITTGESPGNDIDLNIYECPLGTSVPTDPNCKIIGQSGGSTDVESVTFRPNATKLYAASVVGYNVSGLGIFTSTEKMELQAEKGSLLVSGNGSVFKVDYSYTPEQLSLSRLLKHELFTSGKCRVTGALTLKSTDGLVLKTLSVLLESSAR